MFQKANKNDEERKRGRMAIAKMTYDHLTVTEIVLPRERIKIPVYRSLQRVAFMMRRRNTSSCVELTSYCSRLTGIAYR